MESMGLKFTSVIGRHLLHHLSMFGPMAGTLKLSWKNYIAIKLCDELNITGQCL